MKDRILTRYTSADLRYDSATHTTVLPDGTDVPHVTKILAETGVATDFEQVMIISRRHRAVVEDRRELGTVVHQACHYYDDNDLVWATLDPRVAPYVTAWQICRQNLGLVPVHRERQVFHAADEYTGIFDGIFEFTPGLLTKRILIDLKIGDPKNAGAKYQTAAYVAAFLAEHPNEQIDGRWAVRLMPERQPVPYSITDYNRFWQDDYREFRSFLTTYRSQQRTA
jgi:hypothetical protein